MATTQDVISELNAQTMAGRIEWRATTEEYRGHTSWSWCADVYGRTFYLYPHGKLVLITQGYSMVIGDRGDTGDLMAALSFVNAPSFGLSKREALGDAYQCLLDHADSEAKVSE